MGDVEDIGFFGGVYIDYLGIVGDVNMDVGLGGIGKGI